jgi:hypothetical protein
VCGIELKYAVELSKRVVPVVIRDTPVAVVPAPLPDISWLFVRQDTFGADVARLVDVLQTDIGRVHLHTRLLVRATEWENRGGDKSLLLRGAQLAESERWFSGITRLCNATKQQRSSGRPLACGWFLRPSGCWSARSPAVMRGRFSNSWPRAL